MQTVFYPPKETWESLCKRPAMDTSGLNAAVTEILDRVKSEGDKALLDHIIANARHQHLWRDGHAAGDFPRDEHRLLGKHRRNSQIHPTMLAIAALCGNWSSAARTRNFRTHISPG